jgi:hypothetical protein
MKENLNQFIPKMDLGDFGCIGDRIKKFTVTPLELLADECTSHIDIYEAIQKTMLYES